MAVAQRFLGRQKSEREREDEKLLTVVTESAWSKILVRET
jgi:hypothetical protein